MLIGDLSSFFGQRSVEILFSFVNWICCCWVEFFIYPGCVCVSERSVTQSYLTLCYPMNCSLPGSSVHGIFQARILEWLAISTPGDLPVPGIYKLIYPGSDQIRSVAQSCPTLCDPMNRSTLGLPVHHQLLEFTEIHVHRVSDAIQPSHPLSSPSPPAPNPSQHQSLFQ